MAIRRDWGSKCFLVAKLTEIQVRRMNTATSALERSL